METIFDFNPTKREKREFISSAFNKENYLQYVSAFPDVANFHIGLLMLLRGEKEKAASYFDRLKDKSILQVFMQDF